MSGRVYAITGGFGVLGQAVARAALAGGGRVAIIGHAAHGPEAPREDPQTLILPGIDLADPAAAQAAIDAIVERFGRLDALVNAAGGFRFERHETGSAETWRELFRMNLETASNAARAAIPALKRSGSGRIVNIGAASALKAGAGMGAYAAAKAGVHRLTEALAEELKRSDVTVNAVLPSIIDTPANRVDMPKADFATWVSPEDLAAVILFLASESARAVTGALIPVTGRT